METTITAIEMRRKFGGVLDRVARKGEHITILRGNRPLATLIPAQEHQRNCSDQERIKTVQEVLGEVREWWHKNPGKVKKIARRNSTALIRKMRETR